MMRQLPGRLPIAGPLIGTAALIILSAALRGTQTSPEATSWFVLGAYILAMVVGELWSVSMLGVRELPPLASAAALACAMTARGPDGRPIAYGASLVVIAVVIAMAVGVAIRLVRGRPLGLAELSARVIGISVAALLYRSLPLDAGRAVAADNHLWTHRQWLGAIVMLCIAILSLTVELMLSSLLRASRDVAPLWRSVTDEIHDVAPLLMAIATTGVLIAQAMPSLGALAILLFLVPLMMMQSALRRNSATRRTSEQSIRALSKITDISGFTRAGHADRVARLAVMVGRDLGMSARDLVDLGYAALLHDVGQVRLREPIPGGATVQLAPVDQHRIAAEAAAIASHTDALERVGTILASQAISFRQVREFGQTVPLPSRIIKVANALDDMTGGSRDPAVRGAALERITLGLGYEYDPKVVDSLTSVLRREGAEDERRVIWSQAT